jgi:hypothetical protein
MMAVAGILGQELLGVTPAWWEAGAKDYGVPMAPLTAIEFLVRGCERALCAGTGTWGRLIASSSCPLCIRWEQLLLPQPGDAPLRRRSHPDGSSTPAGALASATC